MKDFFKKIFDVQSTVVFTGALPDTRPLDMRQDDIHFSEVVGTANTVVWKVKTTTRQFPELDQIGTFECGAFAARKALGILYSTYPQFGSYVDFSSSHIYQQRAASAGMSLPEIFTIMKRGVTLQALVNDQPKKDADTDNLIIPQWMKGVGEAFAVSGGVYLPNDIDTIASVIQTTGKGVILLTYFMEKEWSNNMPFVINNNLQFDAETTLRHFVVAVDFTLSNNGVKTLIVEDSAWFGGIDRRALTEDWVKRRVVAGGYPMNFKFMPAVGARPTYDGGTTISLQQCLRFDGEFPANVQFVESFGPVTKVAVGKFQAKYGLPVTSTLDGATKNKLHQLYP